MHTVLEKNIVEMQKLAERLKELRERKGWKCAGLDKIAGIPRGYTYGLEIGRIKRSPNPEHWKKILKALGVTEEDFYEKPKQPEPEIKHVDVAGPEVFVPLVGKIAATPFRLAQPSQATRYIPGTRADMNAIALEVEGDSMAPKYLSGEIIFVRKKDIALTPYESDDGESFVPYDFVAPFDGKDCVILHNDESSLKRLRVIRGKGMSYSVDIVPLNPSHPTLHVHRGDEFFVQGVAYRKQSEL